MESEKMTSQSKINIYRKARERATALLALIDSLEAGESPREAELFDAALVCRDVATIAKFVRKSLYD